MEVRVKKDSKIDFAMANNLIVYSKVAFGDPDKESTSQCKFQKLR